MHITQVTQIKQQSVCVQRAQADSGLGLTRNEISTAYQHSLKSSRSLSVKFNFDFVYCVFCFFWQINNSKNTSVENKGELKKTTECSVLEQVANSQVKVNYCYLLH